ncbi:MAG: RNA polymerase sigma factor [Acidimicrobiia bacterium]
MQPDSRTDAEVIASSWTDVEEFGVIFRRHYASVFAFVARRVDRNDAADVTADVFVKAMTIRHRYDTSYEFALPWLYRIAYHAIGDRIRRRKRRKDVDLAIRADRAGARVEVEASDRFVALDVSDDLLEALGRLPKGSRDALLLSALEGLSYSQIGEVLGVSPLTVGSRLSRARRRIREWIPELEQRTRRKDGPRPEETGD